MLALREVIIRKLNVTVLGRYLPNSTKRYYILLYPTIDSPTTSVLAVTSIYLFTSALATPFPSP
jgi:hypothetical protein